MTIIIFTDYRSATRSSILETSLQPPFNLSSKGFRQHRDFQLDGHFFSFALPEQQGTVDSQKPKVRMLPVLTKKWVTEFGFWERQNAL